MASRLGRLMALLGVAVGILAVAGSVHATESGLKSTMIVAALSNPDEICVHVRSRPELAMCEAANFSGKRLLAQAVTCASNEWCCRHDFAKKVCVKCCPK